MTQVTKQHHAHLIKLWAEGAQIQVCTVEGWRDILNPSWEEGFEYRVNPTCPYALEHIFMIGGETALDLYRGFLDGNVQRNTSTNTVMWSDFEPSGDAYKSFFDFYKMMVIMQVKVENHLRDVQDVKYVYWVQYGVGAIKGRFVKDGETPTGIGWYKVPDLIEYRKG